jgi:hypothetical protein
MKSHVTGILSDGVPVNIDSTVQYILGTYCGVCRPVIEAIMPYERWQGLENSVS